MEVEGSPTSKNTGLGGMFDQSSEEKDGKGIQKHFPKASSASWGLILPVDSEQLHAIRLITLVLMNPKFRYGPTNPSRSDYCHCSLKRPQSQRRDAWGKHSLQSPGRWKNLSAIAQGRLEQPRKTTRLKRKQWRTSEYNLFRSILCLCLGWFCSCSEWDGVI